MRIPRAAAAMAAGAALVLLAQMTVAQVAGGFRQSPPAGPAARLDAAVRQLGIGPCAPVFHQAGTFLFEDAPAQFVVQPLGADPNRWPSVVTIEGAYPMAPRAGTVGTTQTRLTTLIVAPAGTCSGLYNQVIYWPEPCASLKSRVFSTYGNERPLYARVRQSEANPGLQVYLMPAGTTGCVSVKKELIG